MNGVILPLFPGAEGCFYLSLKMTMFDASRYLSGFKILRKILTNILAGRDI